ncbi:MAG: hypothetical protein JWO82_770 [Akkermansiaceae bacterium]|nr:hypothetical protein [Akkermansiaceae bacterium]
MSHVFSIAEEGVTPFMQILVPYEGSPEDYLATSGQRRIGPLDCCPNCRSSRRLRFHGYYERFVSSSSTGEAMLVKVRRYRCRECRLTASLLPRFCLTYRLVRGESVARFLRGGGIDSCDLRWHSLLLRCRQRFRLCLPALVEPVHSAFGTSISRTTLSEAWQVIEDRLGPIGVATSALLSACGTTFLGRYLCHRPGLICSQARGDHTNLLFSSGRDPPT